MKKLMIAAAIVCAAALTQAATFSWKVSSCKTPDPTKGGEFSKNSLGSKGTFSVWLVKDEATFNAIAIADIYATYNGTTEGLVDSKATSSSSATITSADAYAKGNTVYAVSLLTYTDADNNVWYIANKSIDTIGDDGDNMLVSNMNTAYGGATTSGDLGSWSKDGITSGDAITGWTKAAAVPEPTSGLLLLLGVAGLALRRRRA